MTFPGIRLAGEVRCERHPGEALSLVLQGTEAAAQGATPIEIAFTAPQLPELPSSVRNALIEERALPGGGEGRGVLRRFVVVAERDLCFGIQARSVHVHRDARTPFFAAVPPARAPLARRIFFRLITTVVATRPGRGLLRRLRNR